MEVFGEPGETYGETAENLGRNKGKSKENLERTKGDPGEEPVEITERC